MKGFFLAILSVSVLLWSMTSCHHVHSGEQTVTFDTLVVDTVCPLFASYEKPACHIAVNMSVPKEGESADLATAIERFITQLPKEGAFEDTQEGTVSAMVKAYVHNYIVQYLSEGPDAIDSYGEDIEAAATWMSYEETVDGCVLYNNHGLLSYQVRIYSYTGGAHGNTKTYNGVFDLQAKEVLCLSNIFEELSLNNLNQLMRQRLAQQYECQTVEELSERQLFFAPEEIEATENFYVGATGISWLFDPYDIAPYSTGEVVVELTWDELYPLLKSDTPIMKLASN